MYCCQWTGIVYLAHRKPNWIQAAIGVGWKAKPLDPVKREAGASPARSRRCNKGVAFRKCHWSNPGRWNEAMILKSEDLPMDRYRKTTRNWFCTHKTIWERSRANFWKIGVHKSTICAYRIMIQKNSPVPLCFHKGIFSAARIST